MEIQAETGESSVPMVMLIFGLVWMCLSMLPWLLLLFLTMLSVTFEDEPGLWLACGAFLPAIVLGAVFLAVGYAKNKKFLMAIAPLLPTIAVAIAWLQAWSI